MKQKTHVHGLKPQGQFHGLMTSTDETDEGLPDTNIHIIFGARRNSTSEVPNKGIRLSSKTDVQYCNISSTAKTILSKLYFTIPPGEPCYLFRSEKNLSA